MIAEQVNPALKEVSIQLLEDAAKYGYNMFLRKSTVAPAIFFVKNGRFGHVIVADLSEDTKDNVATFIHEIRKSTDCTVFIGEVWAHFEKLPKGLTDDAFRRHVDAIPQPSEMPDREEGVMLLVYEGERKIIFLNKISRNPDALGEFKLSEDSSATGTRLSGRFIS
jgi:hypothetical protein